MSVGISIKLLNKGFELYWGKVDTEWELLGISATVLFVNVAVSIKV